jgi:DHA2 family multidrug resistance protein
MSGQAAHLSNAASPAALVPVADLTMLLAGLGLATGMEFYTFDSMNLVLTDLTGTLGISSDESSWILTVYSSALLLGVPVSMWMAGHYGHRRFLIGSVILYVIASLGCASAPDLQTMLIWRAIQGFAGAGLIMWWRASVYMLLTKQQRSVSLMCISTMLYLSSAAGLLISGYVTDHYSWRLIFLPNLLYGAGAVALLARYFPHVPPSAATRMKNTDWLGIALIAVALISAQIILSRGPIDDWFGAPSIQYLAWAVGISFVGFVGWQMSPRNAAPLVSLTLLRDRYVLSSALIGICTGMILSGSLFVLPEFLRNIDSQTHSATQTGRIISVYALTAAAIRPLMVGVIAKFGQRKVIAGALCMLIASMVLFNRMLTADTPDAYYILPLVFYAFCLSPLLPAVGSGTVARVEQPKLLDGVTIYMSFRQFGASLGVGLLTVILEWRETLHSTRLFEALSPARTTTQNWLNLAANDLVRRGGYTPADASRAAPAALQRAAAQQVDVLSYADAFAFMAMIGVLALCLISIIPPTPVARK